MARILVGLTLVGALAVVLWLWLGAEQPRPGEPTEAQLDGNTPAALNGGEVRELSAVAEIRLSDKTIMESIISKNGRWKSHGRSAPLGLSPSQLETLRGLGYIGGRKR